MLFTGGVPRDGKTEAAVMRQMAIDQGMPPDKLYVEPKAATTVENARNSAAIMQARGWRSAIVVSDPPHLGYALPVFRDAFAAPKLELHWAPVDYAELKRRKLLSQSPTGFLFEGREP